MEFLRKARAAALIEKNIEERKQAKIDKKIELRKELGAKLQDIVDEELNDENAWMKEF